MKRGIRGTVRKTKANHLHSRIFRYILSYHFKTKNMNQDLNTVPQEILRQLGGRRFALMTGSKSFMSTDNGNGLAMKLSRNSSGANYLKIVLNGMDTYDLRFISVRGTSRKDKKVFNNIYSDQLQEIFTAETGLYTRL